MTPALELSCKRLGNISAVKGNNQAWTLFLLAHDWKIFMILFFHWHDSLIQSERHLVYSFSAHFRNWEDRGPGLKMVRKKGRRGKDERFRADRMQGSHMLISSCALGFNCPGKATVSVLVSWVRGNCSVHFYIGQAGVHGNTTPVRSVVKIR